MGAGHNMKNGQMHGINEWYYPSGKLKNSAEYKNNQEHGLSEHFYEDGQLQSHSTRINGKFQGKMLVYYENGQLKEESYWENGFKNGSIKQYNPDGAMKVNHNYVMDQLDGLNQWYHENGKVSTSCYYENGVSHGLLTRHDPDGFLKTESMYKNDKLDGITKNFFAKSNTVKEIKEYKEDRLEGSFKTLYRNGQLKWDRSFKDNTLSGIMKLFHQNGAPIAEFTYSANKISDVKIFDTEVGFNLEGLGEHEQLELYKDVIGLAFAAEKFDVLEKLAEEFRETKSRFAGGRKKLKSVYNGIRRGFGDISKDNIAQTIMVIKKWGEQYPSSVAQKTALIQANIDMAWFYRQGGWAKSVSQEGYKKFNEYMLTAYRLAKETMKGPINDPNFYTLLLDIGRALDLPREEQMHYLEQSIRLDSAYYPSYQSFAFGLLPRWGGEEEDVQEFAQWITEKTQKYLGFEEYVNIAMYLKQFVGDELLTRFGFSWDRLRNGFETMYAQYPSGEYTLHSYAWFACHAQDKEAAARAFGLLGDSWDDQADDIWRENTVYDKCKSWAGGGILKIREEIHVLAKTKDESEKIKETLEDKSVDIDVQDIKGMAALHHAIKNGNIENAVLLIDEGANVHIPDNNKKEPLHYAAKLGYLSLVKKLIAMDAAMDHRDRYGFTPLHYAANNGFEKIVEVFLLSKTVDINSETNKDKTALFLAAESGHVEIVKLFLARSDINVNLKTRSGFTPLHAAAQKGFFDIVKLLVENSADVNLPDNKGMTPAVYARFNGYSKIYDFLESKKEK